MTNHPNRKSISVSDKAVGLLIKDKRSGYAEADSRGKSNIRRRYHAAISEGLALDDGGEPLGMTATQVADWYVSTFWR